MSEFQKNKYRFSSAKPLILVGDDIIEFRNEEINKFLAELMQYKVLLRDLINNNIDYSERNEALNIALYIVGDKELYEEFINSKEIPVDKLYEREYIDKKVISKYREYLIAYILIFANDDYKYIQDYVQIVEQSEDEVNTSLIKYEKEEGIRGLVIGKNKRNAIIITSLGEFKKVALIDGIEKGYEIRADEKKSFKDYKLYISIASIFIVVFVLTLVYKYNNVVSTIVVETSSPIRLEINEFNRVLNITSPTEKGNKLIEETKLQDKEMDESICTIIQYADNNEMIKSSGIVVTITGRELANGSIKKTEKYVYENDINVRFNNSGLEHKIN